MNILCVAATTLEIEPFLRARPAVDHLITGVGSPAALYHLQKRLGKIDYDLVIQAGIAGAYYYNPGLGDTVLVKQDIFADLGIYEQNRYYTLFEKDFAKENDFPFEEGWLKNSGQLINDLPDKKVTGLTVNTITENLDFPRLLANKFNADIETMEGAALHYVCLQEGIPFLQLRSISNAVGERDKSKWKMKEAIHNLNNRLIAITDQLMDAFTNHGKIG